MILKNKLTRETLDIPYSEFRKKFAKEIQDAFESYRKTQLNKYSWHFKDDNSLEFNFYFELHWDFADWRQRAEASACPFNVAKQEKHFISNWYIDRMQFLYLRIKAQLYIIF